MSRNTLVGAGIIVVAVLLLVWIMSGVWSVFYVLTALTTPMIAVIALYIAYEQWHLANSKFKLDLFEKRFVIYKNTERFCAKAIEKLHLTPNEFIEFSNDVRDAPFLFDQDILDYLREIKYHAKDITFAYDNIESVNNNNPDSDKSQFNCSVKKKSECGQWFFNQLDYGLVIAFRPYLRLSHRKFYYI